MTLLGFVVPVRSRDRSSNWGRDCALLCRTVGSLLQQVDAEVRVYVVCSDAPDIGVTDERYRHLCFPFPFVPYQQLTDWESYASKHYDGVWAERTFDQGRKTILGCSAAIADGCTFLMSVDADDMISCHVAKTVASDTSVGGWYAETGYWYHEKSRKLVAIPKNMADVNGSTNVLRSDIVKVSDLASQNLFDFNLFAAHGWVRSRIPKETGLTMRPFPFPAVVATIHGDNWSVDSSSRSFWSRFKGLVRNTIRRRRLTTALAEEFGIREL